MIALYDSHCHLDAPEFDADRPAVVSRARAAGVQWQLVPAVTRASWPKLRAACALDDGLLPAYGLHPMFLDQHQPSDLDDLADWITRERPAAVDQRADRPRAGRGADTAQMSLHVRLWLSHRLGDRRGRGAAQQLRLVPALAHSAGGHPIRW